MAKKTGKMSKTDAVRETLKEGVEKPAEGVEYVKSKFGLDVSAQMFSLVKSKEKKKAEGGINPVGIKPRRVASDNGNAAELARAVKQLVEQYGAGVVQSMVAVFAE